MPANLLVRTRQSDNLRNFLDGLIVAVILGIAINPQPIIVKIAVGQNTIASVSAF